METKWHNRTSSRIEDFIQVNKKVCTDLYIKNQTRIGRNFKYFFFGIITSIIMSLS